MGKQAVVSGGGTGIGAAVARAPVDDGDIAAAVRYLTGPDFGYVTGQILAVNGGIVFGR